MYVLYLMDENETGVIMTTMKLKAQLADVDNALAGALIRRGTISAGYSHVIPNHPIAKNVLKTKRNTAAQTPPLALLKLVATARTTMEADMPIAPKIMRLLRPNLSIVNTAIHEAAKYSVPFAAAIMVDRVWLRPI